MLSWKNIKHFLVVLSGILCVTWIVNMYFGPTVGQEFDFTWLYAGNYNDSSKKIVIVKVDNKTLSALQSIDLRVLNFTKTQFSDLIEKLE